MAREKSKGIFDRKYIEAFGLLKGYWELVNMQITWRSMEDLEELWELVNVQILGCRWQKNAVFFVVCVCCSMFKYLTDNAFELFQ